MYPNDPASAWNTRRVLDLAVTELCTRFSAEHPEAAAIASRDAHAALARIPNLNVERAVAVRDPHCPIDGTYDPSTQTIRYREHSDARDRFTLLHELGHHLLAIDREWSLSVAPQLDAAGLGSIVEEQLVSAFAARALIPPATVAEVFRHGVSASAVRDLYLALNASATACLVRALDEPGDRLVLLTDLEGRPYFADTTGEPYSPGRSIQQPAIAAAVERAQETDSGTFRLDGNEGILYRSGKTNPHVKIDVSIEGALVFAVVEPTLPDDRLRLDSAQWDLECVAGCGHRFSPDDAIGDCPTCRQPKCPRCRHCACNRDVYCSRCNMALPTALARGGATLCEDCS